MHQASLATILSIFLLLIACSTHAEDSAIGEVIDAKGDEIIRRDINEGWQAIEIGNELKVGDELKTGDFGALALLFEDDTQVRLHRNSYFVVEGIRDSNEISSRFKLINGALWSRATAFLKLVTGVVKSKQIVTLDTPTTTIGIRGTDWYVNVDPETGASRVVLLTGEAKVYNEFGEVTINGGEEAEVLAGQAPVKRVIVDLKDTPLFVLEYSPEWFDFLNISSKSQNQLQQLKERQFDTLDPIDQLEALYDLGDYQAVTAGLTTPINTHKERAQLLQGLLLARQGQYQQADTIFDSLSVSQQSRISTLAKLATVASLMHQKQYQSAQQLLDSVTNLDVADVSLFKTIMAFQAGDYDRTFKLANAGANRFNNDQRFRVVLANAYLLTGQSEKVIQTLDQVVRNDPDNLQALHLRGVYYSSVAPDADEALASFHRALELNPNLYTTRNNLALLYWDLGDYDQSLEQLARAKADSRGESLIIANQGFQAANLEYLQQADEYYEQALNVDPSQPFAISGEAYLALARGQNDLAIEKFLQLITINPKQPGAHTSLAIAYYQSGRRAAAQAMIDRALELDPNDPVAAQIGATFALDQADIAKAIPLAQAALERSLKFDTYAVESLASARSGLTNIGSAYLNLGLTDWANYYAQLSFTPYLANSHALLSTVYTPRGITATNSALNMSLTLEPTAISAPNRYFQFIREPGNFFTIGGSIGDQDETTNWSGSFTAQGFQRLPTPIAYRLDYSKNHNEGLRINSEAESETLNISVGTHLPGRKHHFNLNLLANQSETGDPGDIFDNDPDDVNETTSINASLSYHLRLTFDNKILARIGFQNIRSVFRNPSALGSNSSDLISSLLFGFGEQQAVSDIQAGLTDLNAFLGAPCAITLPCVGTGPLFVGFGPPILDALPAIIEDDPTLQDKTDIDSPYFQFRHLFKYNDVDMTYGFEVIPQRSRSQFVSNVSDTGLFGLLLNATDVLPFPIVTGSQTVINSTVDPLSANVYSQARWKITDRFWTDAGLFLRHYDNDITDPITRLDPRLGFGWRVNNQHWLRAGYQRQLVTSVSPLGVLAPVATMGFVAPLTQVLNGSRLENLQLQWDGQWSKRVFTVFRYERQNIDGWTQLFSPVSVFVDAAKIQTLEMGLNVWLFERFGLSAKYILNDSDNDSLGFNNGNDLPLIADENLSFSLNWIHPKQITASLTAGYVGDRFSDVANTQHLNSFWTTGFSLGWQPLDRHVSVGFSVSNLFNEEFDLATGFPAGGRSAVASVQVRF